MAGGKSAIAVPPCPEGGREREIRKKKKKGKLLLACSFRSKRGVPEFGALEKGAFLLFRPKVRGTMQ